MPDEPLVAYWGNGLEDVFMIFISIGFMVANIKVHGFEKFKSLQVYGFAS
jgi:hypothetical protein